MSGPSAQQIQLGNEQMQFYQQGMQESQTTFAEQQGLISQMEAVYNPIIARGPSQEGFSGGELSTLDAQAVQGTAANYTAAAKAVGGKIATEGGDSNPLTSGAQDAIRANVATSAAAEESGEESQILQADYAQGQKNFEEATGAIETLSGQLNPESYETAATGAGSAAESTEASIVQEEQSKDQAIIGAIGGVAGAIPIPHGSSSDGDWEDDMGAEGGGYSGGGGFDI